MQVKRLTPAKLKERQEKGLCFKCNDKYGRGHRCKRLFLIEAYRGEDNDGNGVITEEEEEVDDSPKISLHAITGRDALDTMKIYGQIGRSISLVLIDSESTHNFMSLALAEVLELILKRGEAMEVIVASGKKIQSPEKCNPIVVELQGWNFHIEFFVLPLEGYGIVLGAQWLHILGPIWWDFEELKMKFNWEGKLVTLHGVRATESPTKELHTILSTKNNVPLEEIKATRKEKTEDMEAILEASTAIFEEP